MEASDILTVEMTVSALIEKNCPALAAGLHRFIRKQEAIDAATRKLVVECEAAVTALLDEGRDGTAQQLSKALAELKEASK